MKSYIAALKSRLAPSANRYLRALRADPADTLPAMSREDFIETQVQFLFAVVFFSRPMAALAGRMPRPELRLSLLENVADEHGDGNLSLCHEQTFLRFLDRLGVPREDIEPRTLWPEVRAFNTALAGVCMLDDLYTALAALGIIEDLFSSISAQIGRAVIDRGFLGEGQIVHYKTHEELDVAHAEGFYQPLYAAHAEHPRHAYQIEQGLELGGYVFMRLYDDLYENRTRRWRRAVRGPHSLADGWYLG